MSQSKLKQNGERNQSLLMEMMHQQNLLLRARLDERADVSTNKKVKKTFKSANELGLYL